MNQCVAVEGPCHAQYWVAKLELGFQKLNNRTILAHRKHTGPVRVQKMLWPEKTGVCHAIIVHPPAGIAGGDHLSFKIAAQAHSHALVTTPGAGKWYKTNHKQAFQHIDLTVDEKATLEWLPQETMLFNGACAHSTTQVTLAETASFMGWDMLVLGRQACQEQFNQGSYSNQFQLRRADQLLVADCLNFYGGDRWLSSCLGMRGYAVMGSFWAVAPPEYRNVVQLEAQLSQIRELMTRMRVNVTLSLLGDVVCARYLGNDVRHCHDAFAAIRAKLRLYWFDLDEEFPRIWKT